MGETNEIKVTDTEFKDPTVQTGPVRPEYVPEKFFDKDKGTVNVEALAKSYTELERSRATPTKVEEPKTDKLAIEPSKTAPNTGSFTDQEVETWSNEFLSNGKLSDQTYTELGNRGFNRMLVDNYLAGQVALAERTFGSAFDLTGGEQNYTSMVKWASGSLSKAEQQAYNDAMKKSGAARDSAISGLYARYAAAEGSAPARHISGEPPSGGGGFRSQQEMMRAIADPRYRDGDKAYIADVEQKIISSTF